MLITRMNHQELLTEISDDLKRLSLWFQTIRPEVMRWSKKQKLPAWFCKKWTSPHKNVWNIMWKIEEHRHKTGSLVEYTTINGPHGFYVIKPQLTMYGFVVFYYIPHFFKRYRERMGLDVKMKTEQVARQYLRRNSEAVNTGDDFDMELTTKDGIALGNMITPRLYIIRTFITYEMSKGDQVDRFHGGNDFRKEMPNFTLFDKEIISEMREIGIDAKEFAKELEAYQKEKQLKEQSYEQKD